MFRPCDKMTLRIATVLFWGQRNCLPGVHVPSLNLGIKAAPNVTDVNIRSISNYQ
jgi:hypothetical protein